MQKNHNRVRVQISTAGRSGSTMLRYILLGSGKATVLGFPKDMGKRRGNHCNHWHPHEIPVDGRKVLFIYADPVDVMLSLIHRCEAYGKRWMSLHYRNVMGDFSKWGNWDVDSLKIERIFNAFMKPQPFELLSLKYESLWSDTSRQMLDEYLGFAVPLPPYRHRVNVRARVRPQIVEKLENTFAELKVKMDEFDDAIVWNTKVM